MMAVGIYLPTQVYWRGEEVRKLTAEGLEGFFTLLPKHIDYIAVLVPGILIMETDEGKELYFAVDHGALIKQGKKVTISTRNCVQGDTIATLAKVVDDEFKQLDDLERKARTALSGLEHTMMRRFAELRKG